MLSFIRKYRCIFAIILISIISIASITIVFYKYNKQISSQNLSSYQATIEQKVLEKSNHATLALTSLTGNFYIGDTINFSLFVDAFNQSINTVEGKITFPSDKLEILSLSKTDSIISLWIKEPVLLSNQNGSVAFSGGLPSPGFIGLAGEILTLSFKVKQEGNAVINIEDAHVLANNGLGTDVLTEIKPSYLTLLKPKIKREISDVDENGRVDLVDFSILITNWGTPKNERADLNGDGKVDIKDFSILLSKWSSR